VERLVSGKVVRVLLLILQMTESFSSPGTFEHKYNNPNSILPLLTIYSNAVGPGANSVGIPANGKVPISTLEQAVANFNVNPSTGLLTQQDYFEPYEYDSLNGGDRDFGSSGSALLDPTTFSAGGVNRIIVAGGKSGKVYFLNADNLGGFSNGKIYATRLSSTCTNGNPGPGATDTGKLSICKVMWIC